ncbi:MAG TPA: V4R domain-containing protein [Anaerolineales bacterium]|nr:V4R domain-containing protein [Anaerolineales bacterium]
MTEPKFSSRILRRFVEAVAVELGADQFHAMLALSELPSEWAKPQTFQKMGATKSAEAYAALQASMRAYFGRGARGVLMRVGRRLWHFLLEDAALGGKAQAALIKRLPLSTRRHKSTLELLARLIGSQADDITVHTLDLDLMVVDHASPAAQGQSSSRPICFVTQGLIRESLFWATGQALDVEESSCKAVGHETCEFRVTTGRAA